MSTLIPLAFRPISSADQISVELVTPPDAPAIVRVTWPMAASVSDPGRFPAVALAVIAVMDDAMTALAQQQQAKRR
jgi:hypothetical protein